MMINLDLINSLENYSDINDNETNIMNASKSCPVNAIIIVEVDDKGNEIRQVWPEV